MKIVIVPDSFKGSLSSADAADAIECGVRAAVGDRVLDIVKVPIADGGEGTVEAMVAALGGEIVPADVTGPMGEQVEAFFGVLADGETAVIEMAASSGLPLVEESTRNPLKATSFGVGELVAHALERGCRKLYIGVGGSATNDGGMGMAQALGVVFRDAGGNVLGHGADQMARVASIDCDELNDRLAGVSVTAVTDVTNTLCGDQGATYVFGPQKGATEEMLPVLDAGMRHYAKRIRAELGLEVLEMPGAGAGGGMGAGLAAFLGADLRRGFDVVSEVAGLHSQIADANLVITGEGLVDSQTAFGKVPAGVAAIARKHNVPVICLAGGISGDLSALHELGVTACFSIVNRPMTLEEAMHNVELLLVYTTEQAMRLFQR